MTYDPDEADFKAWTEELDDDTRLAWLAFELEATETEDHPS